MVVFCPYPGAINMFKITKKKKQQKKQTKKNKL